MAALALAVTLRHGTAAAQPLQAPSQLRVEVHAGVADQRFLPLLLQRLQQALAVPVEAGGFALELAPYRPRWLPWQPLDAQALLETLIAQSDWSFPARATRVFLIGEDLRLAPARYSFAASHGTPATRHRVSVLSLARLQEPGFDGRDTDPQRTANRAFKLVLKNVARLAGHTDSQRCVMGIPASLAELDALPENFCEPDLSTLAAAGIARRP